MPENRILVIGTTPDYIAHIHGRYPGKALFITDPELRAVSLENRPDEKSELLCDLRNTEEVIKQIDGHCRKWGVNPSGLVCFDCEWLELAARVAGFLSLAFPAPETMAVCRSKYLQKKAWAENGVDCARFQLIHSEMEAVKFIRSSGHPIVLKPLTGSGSELTFLCRDSYEAFHSCREILSGLRYRKDLPLFSPGVSEYNNRDLSIALLAEEFVEGREYSCDFIIDHDNVEIIRIAKKIYNPDLSFGTALAYEIPARLPERTDRRQLAGILKRAAAALNIERAICMVDFMITRRDIVLLEMTPRIGGDCLPPLIRQSCGLDMLGLALDFAEGRRPVIPPQKNWRHLAGVRIIANRDGAIKSIDTGPLSVDRRVVEVYLKRSPGHHVVLPPDDYDSRLIGHIIFQPDQDRWLPDQCDEIVSKLRMEMEPENENKLATSDFEGHKAAE